MKIIETGSGVETFWAKKSVEILPKVFWVCVDVGVEVGSYSKSSYFVPKGVEIYR